MCMIHLCIKSRSGIEYRNSRYCSIQADKYMFRLDLPFDLTSCRYKFVIVSYSTVQWGIACMSLKYS